MAKSSKRAKKKHSKPLSPQKKQEKVTSQKRMTALGRHMERAKAKE